MSERKTKKRAKLKTRQKYGKYTPRSTRLRTITVASSSCASSLPASPSRSSNRVAKRRRNKQ